MTNPEKKLMRERILRCQQRRKLRTAAVHPALEEPQTLEEVPEPPEQLDAWERASREERLSLLAQHATGTQPVEGTATSSGSTQSVPREVIDVGHISATSPNIVTTRQWGDRTLSRGMAFQIHRPTGRTRLISTGKFIPDTGGDPEPGELEDDHQVAAVIVGAVTTTG